MVVDDETEIRTFFNHFLKRLGHPTIGASCGREVDQILEGSARFNLAMVDLKLPDTSGIEILKKIKQKHPSCPVVIMTGYSTVRTAVEAIRLGAYDYLDKPFDDLSQLTMFVERALNTSRKLPERSFDFHGLTGHGFLTRNPAMLDTLHLASRLAAKDLPILINGETGTGKEVLANFIHHQSMRKEGTFLAVNCGAFAENLLASELFGHEKGAFTGASGTRKGIFELADRGTLFLDEIAEAPMSIQVNLLRVLETGEYTRLGGEKPLHTRARILAATHVDLESKISTGAFRQDLLFRLDVVRLFIPPLRERLEDIQLLADHFLRNPRFKTNQKEAGPLPELSADALICLQSYPWPGNVRELANLMSSLLATCSKPLIETADLPSKFRKMAEVKYTSKMTCLDNKLSDPAPLCDEHVEPSSTAPLLTSLEEDLGTLVKKYLKVISEESTFSLSSLQDLWNQSGYDFYNRIIDKTLEKTKGDRRKAAALLGITPRQLRYLYKETGN